MRQATPARNTVINFATEKLFGNRWKNIRRQTERVTEMEEKPKSASQLQIEERQERIRKLKNYARSLTMAQIDKFVREHSDWKDEQTREAVKKEGLVRKNFIAHYIVNLVFVKESTAQQSYYEPLETDGFFNEFKGDKKLLFCLSDKEIDKLIAKYREETAKLGD